MPGYLLDAWALLALLQDEAIVAAAEFKIAYTMSYADGFAAAAAEKLNAVLVTGDPELLQLDGRLSVERLERAKK